MYNVQCTTYNEQYNILVISKFFVVLRCCVKELRRGEMLVARGLKPRVIEATEKVLAEFLPAEAKIVTKREN